MERAISMSKYRESVRRDLEWLLNSHAHPPGSLFRAYPDVERSVLNFGYRNLAGFTVGELEAADLEREMTAVIRAFEPRIFPETVKVTMDGDVADDHILSFIIEGDLWARPIPERLLLKTSLDLDTGRFLVGDKVHE